MNTNITNKILSGSVRLKRKDLIEPELSYKLVGVLFRVSNELGPGPYEKNYQKATATGLAMLGVNFKQQVQIPLKFSGTNAGDYFADFIIEDRVVLELKTGLRVNRKHASQVLAYLKATGLRLGILAYFGRDGVSFKRILNADS